MIVEVRDDSGTLLRQIRVPNAKDAGTNAELAGITDPIDIALLLAAPEVCPYDCDHCRS